MIWFMFKSLSVPGRESPEVKVQVRAGMDAGSVRFSCCTHQGPTPPTADVGAPSWVTPGHLPSWADLRAHTTPLCGHSPSFLITEKSTVSPVPVAVSVLGKTFYESLNVEMHTPPPHPHPSAEDVDRALQLGRIVYDWGQNI